MAGESASGQPGALLRARFEASRAKLMAAITGLDDTALRARTAPGVWTPAELLAHLYSTERIFVGRARQGVEQDGYAVTTVSADVREEHLGMAKRMPVPQIIHGLLAQRRDTLEFVESLSEDELARTLHHPVRGDQTVRWQLEHTIEHEIEHADEISVRRAAASGASA